MYLKYQIKNIWTLAFNNANLESPTKARNLNIDTTLFPVLLSDTPRASKSSVRIPAEQKSIWTQMWNVLPFNYNLEIHPIEHKFANIDNLYQLHVYNSGKISEPLSFSFASCGLLLFYELGAALAIQQMVKREYLRDSVFIGCEAGCISATCLALNIDIDRIKDLLLDKIELIMLLN